MKKAILALAVLAISSSAMALDTGAKKCRPGGTLEELTLMPCEPEAEEGMSADFDWPDWAELEPVEPAQSA